MQLTNNLFITTLIKIINKFSLILIGGVLILLLLLSYFLRPESEIKLLSENKAEFNTYLNSLPQKLEKSVFNNKLNDSTFFSSTMSSYGNRELFVFKAFPKDRDITTDFLVTIYSKDTKKPLEKVIDNSGVLYNYNAKTYAVFRLAMPYINIDSIAIKRKVLNKWQKKWSKTIRNPFKPIKVEITNSLSNQFNKAPNPYKSIFVQELIDNEILYLPYAYTIIKDSLYETKEDYEKNFINKKLTFLKTEKPVLFLENLNSKLPLKDLVIIKGKQSTEVANLIESFENGTKTLDNVFDLDKMAVFFALRDLYMSICDEYLYFVYNLDSQLLEPFFVHSNCLGNISDYLIKPKLDNLKFINTYISTLNQFTQKNLYQDLILNNKSLENELALINKFYPNKIFDFEVLNINQRMIFENLRDRKAIKPELISFQDNKMTVSVKNLSKFPIQLKSLNHETTKDILTISPKNQILSGETDTIEINLPRSFENLFVSKKNRQTGFILYKHIYELYISYSVLNLDDIFYASIIPYQTKVDVGEDLFRIPSTIETREDIVVYKNKKIITFKTKNIVISEPLIIPKNYTFVLTQGTTIDIVEGGKIISHSPISFKGTIEKPITIKSSDKKGQGILVLSEGKDNIINHTTFDYLSNLEHDFWNVTGAVSFYESPVVLNYVTISNNRCEDALNIIRTNFVINNCTLLNTQSDAFDGDFVEGTIKYSKFINLGNDAIDVSGSKLKIIGVQITQAGDKGLSAGENSNMTVRNVNISTSEIAVAGKDLSTIDINNLTIENTKLAFTAFQKKPEFGPSNITAIDVKMENVEIKYLVESTSSLSIEGVKVETSQNVKDRMYGAEFGISSDETRNKQYN